MSVEPLRWLTAADLFLDRPLELAGPLPDDVRTAVEQAMLTAFDRVVTAAVERRADFLLLAGNAFDENDRSLRARIALLDGLRRLDEQEIAVFVVPGAADPLDAWRSIPCLPKNVAFLTASTHEPRPVVRAGRTVGSLVVTEAGGCRLLPHQVELVKPQEPPAGTQGLGPQALGPRGCTLGEADAEGRAAFTFLPVAEVRWESFALVVHSEMGEDDLLGEMWSAIEQKRGEPGENVWLISWTLHGEGPLFESLEDDDHRALLLEALEEQLASEGPRRVHWLRRLPEVAFPEGGGNRLAGEFFETLEHELPVSLELQLEALDEAGLSDPALAYRLQSLVPSLNPEAVAGHARQLGLTWLGTLPSAEFKEERPSR